ncbi:Undecaprenyl-phosphate 4-deoxy-4-formamido-L-arabinose transferase [bioreactor metagenome]|uniref:Undecaprenyl-phosphate 4-deoxy-4-formamido-L-arabinose transferase n=1 Tax=bioreactor metagenome TaxID=1076179 RepID=A0A644TW85_9ZZZZ|nr:glycosyltransferase family 2 protein [Methanobrevibacter sp.]MEA4957107.1 glycosyltransferase family 2 protein [Methanobrevibacter sp.]
MSVKVSVIVPVYNVEKYLEECLDSIVNQSLKDIEIICVNDGSTDNSLNILEKYSKKDNRIKIITKENGGLGPARKNGLDCSSGEYIFFVDSDDWLSLDALENLYNNAKNNNSDIVIFKFAFVYQNKLEYPNILENYLDNDININDLNLNDIKPFVMNSYFATWLKLFKHEFINKYDDFYFKKISYEDVPFHIQTLLRAEKISYCPETLYFYRKGSPDSILSSSVNSMKIFDIFDIINDTEEFLEKNGFMESYKFEFKLFKLQQINYYLMRCGKEFQEDFLHRSKLSISHLNLNSKEIDKLPEYYRGVYKNIIQFSSYIEVKLENKILKIKIEKEKELNKQIGRHWNELHNFKKEYNALKKKCNLEIEKQKVSYESHINILNKSIDTKNKKIKSKNKLILDMRSSISWKITKPLRYIRNLLNEI